MMGILKGATLCSWSRLRYLHQQHGLLLARSIFSKTGEWPKKLDKEVRFEIEDHWKDKIREYDLTRTQKDNASERNKYYVLSMFPYPSGSLHMGHIRVYTISDTISRFQRMLGKQVIHPMGWDAFGLPAENAAIDRGEMPEQWTKRNIVNMKKQLDDMVYSFDWEREYATCDPTYYKWTQYIFLKMYEAGLVYQKEAYVNWDPVDQTVLANEQIDEEGKSWRSGAVVEKKLLRQWYFQTTKYSKSLIEGLEELEPNLWRDVIIQQRHWIGECNGCRLEFKLKRHGVDLSGDPLSVFTTTPEALCGVSHISISPQHLLSKRAGLETASGSESVQCLDVKAINPLTQLEIPIYMIESEDYPTATDSKLGIPCLNEEDKIFAEKNKLSFVEVLTVKADGTETMINSQQLSGMSREEAYQAVVSLAQENNFGYVTSAKLHDWLISRQRYWGTPIPMIHCPSCKAVPVPIEELPVELPMVTTFSGKGQSPLDTAKEWKSVKCPKCGGAAERETDTMDTFVDSSWYFLRYLDPRNTHMPFSPETANRLMPVDLYIGGKEHAVLHLYFARFFNHFLYNQGMVAHREPFTNLLTQGMVQGKTYRVNGAIGRYLKPEEVDFSGKKPVEKGTGEKISVTWEKMSKSKNNGTDPQEVLEEYGVDLTRLNILSGVAPKTPRKWDVSSYTGIIRWQAKIWTLVKDLKRQQQQQQQTGQTCPLSPEEMASHEEILYKARNRFLKDVSFHLSFTFLVSVGISRLQELTTALKKFPKEGVLYSKEYERALCDLVVMVAPAAPMFASELWEGIRNCAGRLNDHYSWV
ncbi:probable leucine--tRNA ligase, mitochondrial [Lingula anatina]|uniref:leucine--tRNA ligase n=1 Tax=Lingula anatina TaxID=7574 RepID=A0A1S3IPZ2_LINAN|nr:probable leucine--tRNA ligase, mitochondrial [Lingula anatina]|eukprot:XP_013399604.1 probable leucine--tRNA ligase, mitochondrial [Lingula anatina]